MLRLGVILFAIGLFILSPLDEIFILIPLSVIFGLWVFPVAITIGLLCLFIGIILTGRSILPYIYNPIVMLMVLIALIVTVYILSRGVIN
jgi:hypothetical protein